MSKDCQVIKKGKKYGVYSFRNSTVLKYGNKKDMIKLCNYLNIQTPPLTKEDIEKRLLYGS